MSGIERGIYLAADTPISFHSLALEGGDGDKNLLAEALAGILDEDELDTLIQRLIEESNRRADDLGGTTIQCEDCGHVRQTTEENPTLVTCEECGSYNLRYSDTANDQEEL